MSLFCFLKYRITTSEDLSSVTASDSTTMPINQDKCNIIKRELQYVIDETNTKVEKLKLASDIHIGILLLFKLF